MVYDIFVFNALPSPSLVVNGSFGYASSGNIGWGADYFCDIANATVVMGFVFKYF